MLSAKGKKKLSYTTLQADNAELPQSYENEMYTHIYLIYA